MSTKAAREKAALKKKDMVDKYQQAYSEMQRKGYLTHEDLRDRFGKLGFDQIKCNFDNNDFLVYDGFLEYRKKSFPEGSVDIKSKGLKPVLLPCRDIDGIWIADKEIIEL